MPESFQANFCRHFGIPPDRYGQAVMQRTLYPHARWLRWLSSYNSFSADRSFIGSVGRMTRRADLPRELMEFGDDARNLPFWRGKARFRVSPARMLALFREVWPEPAATAAGAGPNTASASDTPCAAEASNSSSAPNTW